MDNTDDGLIEVVLATDYPPLGLAGDAVRVDPMRAEWLQRQPADSVAGSVVDSNPVSPESEDEEVEQFMPARGRRKSHVA